MKLENILTHFHGVKKSGNQYSALCPAHDDHNPSLSIRLSNDRSRVQIHCFAGCPEEKILEKAGLKMEDLCLNQQAGRDSINKTTYEYYSTDNILLYRKTRVDYADGSKSFYFCRPDGEKGLEGVQRVPYNLPAILSAETVYFVEGEKCADALIRAGRAATTLDSGSNSKWQPEYAGYFQNKTVIILPDNDKPGMAYAKMIQQNLPGSKVVRLPGLSEKQDIYDWLHAGHTLEELDALPEEALPSLPDSGRKGATQAETILELVEAAGITLFNNQNHDVYAEIPIKGHKEIWPIESREFSSWLYKLYHAEVGKVAKSESIKQALAVLAAEVQFNQQNTIPLFTRAAEHDHSFWYDLSNPEWQAVHITPDGWMVEDDVPVLFQRYRHQKPQAIPQTGGDIRKILKYINLKEGHTLFLCWLVCCFIPEIPHGMAIFYGEKGAAKSTACSLLKRVVDPSALDVLTMSHELRTMVVNLQQHWFLPFDNVSHINDEMSDTLCRAITGGGIQQRKLFTNAEDYIFTFQRCIAVNGINNVAQRPDLLDRSILIQLQRIPETERRELRVILSEFEQDLPFILGGIFDTLSKAMKIFPTVHLDKLPRMADFARWGYAVGEAFGGYGETFLKEYTENRDIQNMEALQSDVVGQLVLVFMENQTTWTGRVCDLLAYLTELAKSYGINIRSKEFPSQPNGLGRRLNSLKSNLEGAGITFSRRDVTSGVLITLTKERPSPVPPYYLVTTGDKGGNGDESHIAEKNQEGHADEKQ